MYPPVLVRTSFRKSAGDARRRTEVHVRNAHAGHDAVAELLDRPVPAHAVGALAVVDLVEVVVFEGGGKGSTGPARRRCRMGCGVRVAAAPRMAVVPALRRNVLRLRPDRRGMGWPRACGACAAPSGVSPLRLECGPTPWRASRQCVGFGNQSADSLPRRAQFTASATSDSVIPSLSSLARTASARFSRSPELTSEPQ